MDQPSHLCSEDFWPEDFQSQFSCIPGTSFVGQQSLKNDAIPTIQKKKRRQTARANFFEHHQRPTSRKYTVSGLLFLTQSTQKCVFIIVLWVGCKGPLKQNVKAPSEEQISPQPSTSKEIDHVSVCRLYTVLDNWQHFINWLHHLKSRGLVIDKKGIAGTDKWEVVTWNRCLNQITNTAR